MRRGILTLARRLIGPGAIPTPRIVPPFGPLLVTGFLLLRLLTVREMFPRHSRKRRIDSELVMNLPRDFSVRFQMRVEPES